MPNYATFDSGQHPSDQPVHPKTTASWASRALLSWASPLLALGNQKQLDERDVWPLQHQDRAAVITAQFDTAFQRTWSIPRAFLRCFGTRFFLAGFSLFIASAMNFAGPVVLNRVVSELSEGNYQVDGLTVWIFGLLMTQLVQALTDNYSSLELQLIAVQFTGALKNMVYNKALRLDANSRKLKSTGDIANLCKTDSQMIFDAARYVHQLWILPLQVLVTTVLLYQLLGLASFAGFVVIGLTFLINHFLSARFMNAYLKMMGFKDERMNVVTEAFKAMSILKFNAWEDQFTDRIDASRAKELKASWEFPFFISVATFAFYGGVRDQPLTPAIVFTSVALFRLVQSPLSLFSHIIASVTKAKVAIGRMHELFELPEIKNDILNLRSQEAGGFIDNDVVVALENASFSWGRDEQPLLRNSNLTINSGDFVVIHGPVGCGKSSLCSALIGDMIKTTGLAYVGGTVAYCSQQPWIQHATVRDNILFGRPFDRKKYDKVLDACALTKDLQSLPSGDRTEIGERGVNLSGGQKARVALARACYSDASIFILDAPLSAVDAIVQNEIFQKCLLGLLRHRTVILVTHNPEVIASEHVTRAVTINEGRVIVATRSSPAKRQFFESIVSPSARRPSVKADHSERYPLEILLEGQTSSSFAKRADSTADDNGSETSTSNNAKETHRLVADEERKQGRVGSQVFVSYYKAIGGFPIVSLILLSQILWQGLQIASDFWLSSWSSDSSDNQNERVATNRRVWVYTLLGLSSAAMVLVRTMAVSFFGLRAAKHLFEKMTSALMHAPMRFFDSTPIGRILLRYSGDVSSVDLNVPLTFGAFFSNFFSAVCTLAVAAVIIQWNGVFLLPVAYLYIRVSFLYLEPAREIERVLNTTEAPILSHLSESIEGGVVIRAFGPQHVTRFQSTNNVKLDTANKVWYARLVISTWFALRIQLLSGLLIFVVAYSLVLLRHQLSAAIVGLAFSYILKVSGSMERIVQTWSSVETIMVSPERMQQFIDVEQELPYCIPSVDPPSQTGWPRDGSLRFDNVSFRYKDSDRLVLNKINVSISGGEKVGIVGRTGAGKSSLTMALFRINELAEGTISLDGVNVGKIGLKALRQKMSIIPQNPVLFKASLRKNLDPFDEFVDDELWEAIRRVGLNDRISNDDKKLECAVEENGENFSVGERQMLCMARALLRDSRIVIFDEATAAIDHETDQKLQRVIREAFDKSTVLTIAHRLDTILDSDRILVLEGGEVVEFASPSDLVKKGSGHFFELMQEGGYLDKFRSDPDMQGA